MPALYQHSRFWVVFDKKQGLAVYPGDALAEPFCCSQASAEKLHVGKYSCEKEHSAPTAAQESPKPVAFDPPQGHEWDRPPAAGATGPVNAPRPSCSRGRAALTPPAVQQGRVDAGPAGVAVRRPHWTGFCPAPSLFT